MKYFNFDQLNPITRYLTNSSSEDQIWSHQRWFNFRALTNQVDQVESLILFFIICFVIYCLVKVFAYFDR